jgi:hypothetical protein
VPLLTELAQRGDASIQIRAAAVVQQAFQAEVVERGQHLGKRGSPAGSKQAHNNDRREPKPSKELAHYCGAQASLSNRAKGANSHTLLHRIEAVNDPGQATIPAA